LLWGFVHGGLDCARLQNRSRLVSGAPTVTVDMAVVVVITGSAGMVLDALGRLALAARRWGGEIRVQDPEPGLVELLDACGLGGVLPAECRRDAEQREQPGVEEGVDPDDPAL
jgi:hypothetical protein